MLPQLYTVLIHKLSPEAAAAGLSVPALSWMAACKIGQIFPLNEHRKCRLVPSVMHYFYIVFLVIDNPWLPLCCLPLSECGQHLVKTPAATFCSHRSRASRHLLLTFESVSFRVTFKRRHSFVACCCREYFHCSLLHLLMLHHGHRSHCRIRYSV